MTFELRSQAVTVENSCIDGVDFPEVILNAARFMKNPLKNHAYMNGIMNPHI